MPVLDVNSAVITYLRGEWSYSAKIEQENTTSKPTAPFIRPTIIPTVNGKVEVGEGGASKYEAILAVDIFTELNTGTGESAELIDNLMGIFPAGLRITSDEDIAIRFTAPQPLQGLDDGHGFWQATVQCPFYFYHRN